MNNSKPNNKFCKNCGAEIHDDVKYCDKCGQSLQTANKNTIKGIRSNKIFLISIVAVLIVVIGIGSYYAYGNYKMSQMDKYMKQSNVYGNQADKLVNQSFNYSQHNDYNNALNALQQAVWNGNQSLQLVEKASEYADGPYKDALDLQIKRYQAALDYINAQITAIQCLQSLNLKGTEQAIKQRDIKLGEATDYADQYNAIKAQNLGMQEHIDKNW